MFRVLQVDRHGQPQSWITPKVAAGIIVSGSAAWTMGAPVRHFRGGVSRMTGRVSELLIPGIVATNGNMPAHRLGGTPKLGHSNRRLFERDRNICAYCGKEFPHRCLTRDHIIPSSRGGQDIWTNVVAACTSCNTRKAAKTPEEARMPLLYVPYVPSRYEHLILSQGTRRILADQMEFLASRLPTNSRLHGIAGVELNHVPVTDWSEN